MITKLILRLVVIPTVVAVVVMSPSIVTAIRDWARNRKSA